MLKKYFCVFDLTYKNRVIVGFFREENKKDIYKLLKYKNIKEYKITEFIIDSFESQDSFYFLEASNQNGYIRQGLGNIFFTTIDEAKEYKSNFLRRHNFPESVNISISEKWILYYKKTYIFLFNYRGIICGKKIGVNVLVGKPILNTFYFDYYLTAIAGKPENSVFVKTKKTFRGAWARVSKHMPIEIKEKLEELGFDTKTFYKPTENLICNKKQLEEYNRRKDSFIIEKYDFMKDGIFEKCEI